MRKLTLVLAVLIMGGFGGWTGMVYWDGVSGSTVTFGQYVTVTVIVAIVETILLWISFPVQRD